MIEQAKINDDVDDVVVKIPIDKIDNNTHNDVDDVVVKLPIDKIDDNTHNDVDDDVVDKISIDKIDNKLKFKTSLMIEQSLWLKFKELLCKKHGYDYNLENITIEEEANQVFMVGLNHSLNNVTTSSTSLLFDGRRPRKDVLFNLAKIARVFLKLETTHLRRNDIKEIMRSTLGPVVERTEKKYLLCIEQHSVKNTQNGTFDVNTFCGLIPPDYLDIDEE